MMDEWNACVMENRAYFLNDVIWGKNSKVGMYNGGHGNKIDLNFARVFTLAITEHSEAVMSVILVIY